MCYGFVYCSNGVLFDKSCLLDIVKEFFMWDNFRGRCEYKFDICDLEYFLKLN